MRVIGFITQPALIDRILDHLRRRNRIPRPGGLMRGYAWVMADAVAQVPGTKGLVRVSSLRTFINLPQPTK